MSNLPTADSADKVVREVAAGRHHPLNGDHQHGDRSDDGSQNNGNEAGTVTTTASAASSSGGAPAAIFRGGFPWKLHQLLDDAARSKDGVHNESIVSWLPNGRAFKIHDRINFVAKVMPIYFKTANYKSFHRSLNLWGFETVRQGVDRGAIYHPYFVRDDPNQCNFMKRVKNKRDTNNVNSSAAVAAAAVASKETAHILPGVATAAPTIHTPPATSTPAPALGGTMNNNKGLAAALSLNGLKVDNSQMLPLVPPNLAGNLFQQQQKSAILRQFLVNQMEKEMAAAAARQLAAAAANAASSSTTNNTTANSALLQELQRQISIQSLLNNNPGTTGNLSSLLQPSAPAPSSLPPLTALAALLSGANNGAGNGGGGVSAQIANGTLPSNTGATFTTTSGNGPATVAEALAILSASSSGAK